MYPGEQTRAYECRRRPGFWHFTSQDSAETETRRIIAAVCRDGGETAARYVAAVVAGTGTGPTWNELCDAMGWDTRKQIRSAIITALAKDGWLATGQRSRSLRPGRRLRDSGHPQKQGVESPGGGPPT
jgi:hypothetical protein